MAVDHKNQRICRIPPERDAEFQQFIPAVGSIYFRPAAGSLISGDGQTPGGQEFVSRAWVLQKIEEANWKQIQASEAFKVETSAINPGALQKTAETFLSPDVFVGFSVYTSAVGQIETPTV